MGTRGYHCRIVQDSARECKIVQDGARWCKMVQDGAVGSIRPFLMLKMMLGKAFVIAKGGHY